MFCLYFGMVCLFGPVFFFSFSEPELRSSWLEYPKTSSWQPVRTVQSDGGLSRSDRNEERVGDRNNLRGVVADWVSAYCMASIFSLGTHDLNCYGL